MTRGEEGRHPDSEREAELSMLEQLVADYVDRLAAGENLDPAGILLEHPALGHRVIEHLRAFVDLEEDVDSPAAPIGTLGDYTLRRQIGRGGMGVVYEAWENSMDRRVALKVLPAGIAADTRSSARFLREAQTAGKLSHPNVVPVYFTAVKDQTPFYAMEYVEGETLAQILARIKVAESDTQTPFGPKDQVDYFAKLARAFADVADGLQHAHSKGVIHRDIKPSNLIRDGEGRLRILDFGLAHLEGQDSLTISGDVVGTPLYMSPEQARRKKIGVDHRTDVYSIGATMYEAICGRTPFQGKDHADTLSQIIERDALGPRKINPCVPKDLETIVLKCLRKEPGERYGTAEALAQDLRRFVRGDMVEARPPSALQTLMRRVVRHRARIGIAALSVAVLLLASTLFSLQRRSRLEEEQRRHAQSLQDYERRLQDGLAGLEIGFDSVPGEPGEGENLSLGLIDPYRLFDGFRGGLHRRALHKVAVERLEDATEVLPDRPEAWVHLSRGRLALENGEAADSAMERALEVSPEFVPALIYKTRQVVHESKSGASRPLLVGLLRGVDVQWKRLWIQSHLAALDSEWNTFERLCGELLDLEPKVEPYAGFRLEQLLRRGRARVRLGRLKAALEDFIVARTLAPDVISTHLLVAAQYYRFGDKDEARQKLAETLKRFPGAEAALTVVDVCLQHADKEHALSLVSSLPTDTRLRTEMAFFRRIGEWENAVTAGLKALEAVREPSVWVDVAHALIELQRIDEAEKLLLEGLREHPADPAISGLLNSRVAYYRGRFEQLLENRPWDPESYRAPINTAWCYYRLGEPEKALASIDRAIRRNPRARWAYRERAFMRSQTGNPQGAVSDAVEALVRSRGKDGSSCEILRDIYSPSRDEWFAPHWDRLDEALREVDIHGTAKPSQLGLRALAALYRATPDPKEALAFAERAVGRASAETRAEALGRLAEVHFVRDELPEAVRAVERALQYRGRSRALGEQLALYRKELFPAMASCSSIDAFVDGLPDADDGSESLRVVRDHLDREEPWLAAYLDARLQEEAGDSSRAAKRLESLVRGNETDDEAAHLRLTRALSQTGRREEAIARLERYLREQEDPSLAAWETWLAVASGAGWPVDKLLDRPLFEGVTTSDKERPTSWAGEVAWVLKKLRDDAAVRINAARGRYEDSEGHVWASDRFADGGNVGWRFFPPVKDTVDPWLFITLRDFFLDAWLTPGYRIPLPSGEYEVTLLFFETALKPYRCRFSIEIEGEVVAATFEPGTVGIRTGVTKRYAVRVDDGSLTIILRPKDWQSTVSAIEVRRVTTEPGG